MLSPQTEILAQMINVGFVRAQYKVWIIKLTDNRMNNRFFLNFKNSNTDGKNVNIQIHSENLGIKK